MSGYKTVCVCYKSLMKLTLTHLFSVGHSDIWTYSLVKATIYRPCVRFIPWFSWTLTRKRSAHRSVADFLFAAICAHVFNSFVCHNQTLLSFLVHVFFIKVLHHLDINRFALLILALLDIG